MLIETVSVCVCVCPHNQPPPRTLPQYLLPFHCCRQFLSLPASCHGKQAVTALTFSSLPSLLVLISLAAS